MSRTTLIALLVLISALLHCTATSNAEPLSSEKRDELFAQTISKHLDLPTNQVLEKSFWTRTELIANANTQLYYCDPFAPGSARIVAAQLKLAYDARNTNNEIESAANEIRALAYVPDGSDFKRDPITDTTLYRALHEESVTDVAAQSWVYLVRHWHEEVVAKPKEEYLPALNQAIQTIPKLAAAIVRTHQAVRETSTDRPAAEPDTELVELNESDEPIPGSANAIEKVDRAAEGNAPLPAEPVPGTIDQGALDEALLANRLSEGLQNLKKKQGGAEFVETCKAIMKVLEDALDEAKGHGDAPAFVETLSSETPERILDTIIALVDDDDVRKAWTGAYNTLVTDLQDNHKGGFDKEEPAHWIAVYQIGRQALNKAIGTDTGLSPEEEENLREFLAGDFSELRAIVEELKKNEKSEAAVQKLLVLFAERIRKVLRDSPESGLDDLRKAVVSAVKDLIDNDPDVECNVSDEIQIRVFALLAGIQSEGTFKDVDEYREFCEGIAEEIFPRKRDDVDSEAALPADNKDSLASLFAELQPAINKFSKSDAETYKRNIRKFLDSIKDILYQQYTDVAQIKRDTKARAEALYNDPSVVSNTKSQQLWGLAYQEFVRWAEDNEEFDPDTVEGWKEALTRMSKVLADSIDAYFDWIDVAEYNFVNTPASARGTSGTGGTQQYATWGAVARARAAARRRARYERNAQRIQAIRGS